MAIARGLCEHTESSAGGRFCIVPRCPYAGCAQSNWGLDEGSYQGARRNTDKLKAAFEKLARTPVDDPTAKKSFETVYPLLPPPRRNAPDEVMKQREKNHAAKNQQIQRFRSEAFALFDGKGRGMRSRAADHTAWGWVNAVTELEDFRKSNFLGGKKGEAQRARGVRTFWRSRSRERTRVPDRSQFGQIVCLGGSFTRNKVRPLTSNH